MASSFAPIALAQLWQVTLLILVVAVVNRWVARQQPHLSHLLWLVVLLKCVTPPLWASSGGVFCWLQPQVQTESAVVAELETSVAWEELLEVDSQAVFHANASESDSAGVLLSDAEADELLHDSNIVETSEIRTDNHRFGEVAIAAWLGVVLLVLLGVTIRWLRFWRLVRKSSQRESPELVALLDSLSQQLGVRRRVRLIVTESLVGPAVIGFFRVTVLIPSVVADRLHGKAVAPILAHELLHIRRGDLWVGLLQTLAQAMWWFHPLVWWVGRLTIREAERCCDEEVLGELKCDPASYARALIDVLDLKSQLKPVPVFPGVRPVDVTSQRLERIMMLRQGCRRRSPWWCWLVAIGAAALTLPGAAFVVSAQEEEPKELTPAEAVPAPLPARSSDGQPKPPRPVLEGQILRAYNVADAESAVTTHVYEIAEITHLLSGSEAEQRQKLERLIRSREQAKDAQINWFDGKPVVRTTNAGHQAVRECIAVFLGSESTAKHLDEFLDSMTNDSQETLVVDLQFVTMSEESFSKVEDAVIALADKARGPDEFPLVMTVEKWDGLHKDVPHDDAWHYLAPQLAVFNGRTVHLESIVQHPPVTVRPVSAYRTHGGLLGTPDWLGWKALALPAIRKDGSFWLGMRFEVQSLIAAGDGSSKAEETAESFRRHEVGFQTTLREGQVVVLPGVDVNYGATADTSGSTFLAARIRRLEPATGPNVYPNPDAGNVPRSVSGVGVNSSAGVTEQLQLQAAERNAAQAEPNSVTATKPLDLTSRQFGSWKLRLQANAEATDGKRFILTMTDASGRSVVSATASDVQINETARAMTLDLTDVKLQLLTSPPQLIVADKLQLISDSTHNATDPESIRMKATSVTAELLTGDSKSSLKAGQLELTLDPQSFKIVQIRGEKLESLQQNDLSRTNASEALTPAVSGNGGEPEDGSLDELKQQRLRQRFERALNTSQALPAPYALGIEGALNRKTNASFQEVSLADAVKELARQQGVNIVLDKRGLEEEGVSLNEKLSIEVSGISLRSVLKLILDPLNLGTRIGEDDVIIVTSRQRVAGELDVRVYPVAALVVPISDRVSIHTDAESGAAATPVTSPAPQLDFEKLIELITSTVDPDSWRQVGGSGSVVANKTTLSLVTRQTPVVHAEIADLLDQLRRLQDLQVTLEMQTLEVPQSFLTSWDIGREFRSLGQSKTQRYMRLTREQAEQLRQGSKAESFPRVTLFNGQVCQWKLGGSDSGQSMLELQPVVSNDRRFVRLGVNQNDAETNGTGADSFAVISPVSNGDAVLLELDALASSGAPFVGVPIPGQPKAFRAAPKPGRFFLIQPQFVIVEEEEELLGSDAGR